MIKARSHEREASKAQSPESLNSQIVLSQPRQTGVSYVGTVNPRQKQRSENHCPYSGGDEHYIVISGQEEMESQFNN